MTVSILDLLNFMTVSILDLSNFLLESILIFIYVSCWSILWELQDVVTALICSD